MRQKEALIRLEDVFLDHFLYSSQRSLKKTILSSVLGLGSKEPTFKLRRALNGVTTTITSGDRVALIGNNGAGKSTFLRLISGIYTPTGGKLLIEGNVSSLLDINVGLNPDITGYENIILMGILKKRTKKEMQAKFEDIEDFTELGNYLHLPVRTYSFGMKLRLAFGVATCIDSEILAIDEVIAVGDRRFMEKSQARLRDFVHKSEILVLASHSTEILKNFCNKAMVLDQGKCLFFGDLEEGIAIHEGKTLSKQEV